MIITPNTSKYYNRQVENRSSFKHQEVENDDVDYSQVSSCAQNKQKRCDENERESVKMLKMSVRVCAWVCKRERNKVCKSVK